MARKKGSLRSPTEAMLQGVAIVAPAWEEVELVSFREEGC